jgi:hypothetical protein
VEIVTGERLANLQWSGGKQRRGFFRRNAGEFDLVDG